MNHGTSRTPSTCLIHSTIIFFVSTSFSSFSNRKKKHLSQFDRMMNLKWTKKKNKFTRWMSFILNAEKSQKYQYHLFSNENSLKSCHHTRHSTSDKCTFISQSDTYTHTLNLNWTISIRLVGWSVDWTCAYMNCPVSISMFSTMGNCPRISNTLFDFLQRNWRFCYCLFITIIIIICVFSFSFFFDFSCELFIIDMFYGAVCDRAQTTYKSNVIWRHKMATYFRILYTVL